MTTATIPETFLKGNLHVEKKIKVFESDARTEAIEDAKIALCGVFMDMDESIIARNKKAQILPYILATLDEVA